MLGTMKLLPCLLAGFLAGAALTSALLWPRAREAGPAPSAPEAHAALGAELGRARDEVAALRARLEEALAAARQEAPQPAAENPSPEPAAPAAAPAPTLEERWARAEETIALLESDPELRRVHERHSREESAYPHWRAEQFLTDPDLNPLGLGLDPEARKRFDAFHARLYQRLRAADLRRQLAFAEALARRLEEPTVGAGGPLDTPGSLSKSGRHRLPLPGGFIVDLAEDEYPELSLLEEEKRAAEISALVEILEFLWAQ